MFRDRQEAGQRLAEALAGMRLVNPVVLALPRGGVPVAREVARALHAPLDLLFVRKIGDAWQPELAVAAVAEGAGAEPVAVPPPGGTPAAPGAPSPAFELATRAGTGRPDEADVARELHEIERRRALYLHGRPRVAVTGRTVVVVDDGIATGTTMRAALRSLRHRHAALIVVAVPVAPPEEVASLREEADRVVCLETPEPFGAVGRFYENFDQVSDDEVVSMLHGLP